jgi:hypothetical protein
MKTTITFCDFFFMIQPDDIPDIPNRPWEPPDDDEDKK